MNPVLYIGRWRDEFGKKPRIPVIFGGLPQMPKQDIAAFNPFMGKLTQEKALRIMAGLGMYLPDEVEGVGERLVNALPIPSAFRRDESEDKATPFWEFVAGMGRR